MSVFSCLSCAADSAFPVTKYCIDICSILYSVVFIPHSLWNFLMLMFGLILEILTLKLCFYGKKGKSVKLN